MSEDEVYTEQDQEMFDEEELDGLLEGEENTGEEIPTEEEAPELTLEGLAGGVQNAINSIVQGSSREFDRIVQIAEQNAPPRNVSENRRRSACSSQ